MIETLFAVIIGTGLLLYWWSRRPVATARPAVSPQEEQQRWTENRERKWRLNDPTN